MAGFVVVVVVVVIVVDFFFNVHFFFSVCLDKTSFFLVGCHCVREECGGGGNSRVGERERNVWW
jgi:hypothetical protein